MDRAWPSTPAPVKASLRRGWSPLAWYRLEQQRAATGQPIVCVACRRVHVRVPPFGGCPCGSYRFEVEPAPPTAATGG
jgi:hypothetical protein